MDKIPQGPIEVLLTDGHTRSCLAVARSLARHGVSFVVLCPKPYSLVGYSRYVKHALPSPDPVSQPDAFIHSVLETIRKYRIRLAIPITDQALVLFERDRLELERHTTLAVASSQAVRCVLDKRKNLQLATQLGVPCPRQFRLESPQQVPEMVETLGFPIVLKRSGDPVEPGRSQFKFKVLYAHDDSELRHYIEQYCSKGEDPLFQEYVTGEVHNLCCLAAKGELLAIHEYHSIRRFNESGVLRKIISPVPELVEHTRKLLAALCWDGVAHVAFFISKDHKKTWYMETNGRFWASTAGSIHAGWDFPYWTYEYFLHGKKPHAAPIKLGSMTRWCLGDFLSLCKFVAGECEAPTTGTNHGKLRAFLHFLSGFHPGIHSDVFRWNDPLPSLVEAWPYCQRVIRALTSNRSAKSTVRSVLFPDSPRSLGTG